MIPVHVSSSLTDAALDVAVIGALSLLIIAGIRAFKWMASAVGGSGYYAGYTVSDDIADRASQYQNERTTFDADGNASLSDSRRDYSDAAKDVIRQQKHF